jgi:hypothetical protein
MLRVKPFQNFWTPATTIEQSYQLNHHNQLSIPNSDFKKTTPPTIIIMHATSLFATIVALSAAVSATPLSTRSANRKANEFSSGDW